eukprot:284440-Amphidinium_carterae.1
MELDEMLAKQERCLSGPRQESLGSLSPQACLVSPVTSPLGPQEVAAREAVCVRKGLDGMNRQGAEIPENPPKPQRFERIKNG